MYNEDFTTEDELALIKNTLIEIAEGILGHTYAQPKSISLLCLNFKINCDQFGKLMIEFTLLEKKGNLDLEKFKNVVMQVCPQAHDIIDDNFVKSLIKAYAFCYLEDLRDFADTLTIKF
ncbi:MAG: hypothetical protein FWG65_05860 [Turicibacter sp.]|nr:hypothetical protein [Turicibacter sp.]